MMSPTRTTDMVFADLFKSKIDIGSNQVVSPYVQLQRRGLQAPAQQGMLTNSNNFRRR